MNTLVWVMAAGLAGLGTLLRLPIQGVAIGSVGGPNVLLIALAAAVVGADGAAVRWPSACRSCSA